MHRTLAVAAAILILAAGCGGSTDKAAPDEPTTSAPTTPKPAESSAAPSETPPSEPATQLLNYENDEDNGATLTSATDVTKLTGAPEDFKSFIAKELAKDQQESDEACSEKPQIYVSRIDTGGWAAGGHFIPQCGGYATLWARPGGTWKEVWGGQQLTDCATLKKYAFPADVVGGTCLDGANEVPYVAK